MEWNHRLKQMVKDFKAGRIRFKEFVDKLTAYYFDYQTAITFANRLHLLSFIRK